MKTKADATTASSMRRTTQRANGRCVSHCVFINGKLERRNLVVHTQMSRSARNIPQTVISVDKSSGPGCIQYPNIPQETAKTITLATADSCRSTNRDKASIFLRIAEFVFSFAGTAHRSLLKETLRREKKYSVLIPKYTETSAKPHANIIDTAIPFFEEYVASKKAADAIAHKTPRKATNPHPIERSNRERKSSEITDVAKSFSIDSRRA